MFEDLVAQAAKALAEAAYDCYGNCGATIGPCDSSHPVHATDWSDEHTQVNGSALDIARIVLQVARASEIEAKTEAAIQQAQEHGCPQHGHDCEPDDHFEPPTVDGEVL